MEDIFNLIREKEFNSNETVLLTVNTAKDDGMMDTAFIISGDVEDLIISLSEASRREETGGLMVAIIGAACDIMAQSGKTKMMLAEFHNEVLNLEKECNNEF